ncbi:NodT family efflux transporter outer membrane factor (OMF) lipoprotein [Herbaspirillum sp. Sphag1AN]|uniref:efflux transporter outer membrane subunit n=1 Tax=unclassified Herbaspirillum TaxID=2624150 RepID=UPI00160AD4BE|nr:MULTISPECIES: efflux transporter outer membrane subunit [unclassified Herbaspirillum]MBB3214096.1 NodT family efflux transporter outer membrane factor (OMF) lipoprotein [Herbaspirillum sp. Sphag1AN]MBB3247817.1 NodT family efflux transporter outer membrane factor (OMF) lipoprotein [Herbaspirillum sp. Sphag64]
MQPLTPFTRRFLQQFTLLAPLALFTLLSACTLGPDYAGPPEAAPHALQSAHFVRADGASMSASMPVNQWWQGLSDPVLNDLIARALQANPNLNIAKARLQQSRAALHLEQANALPSGGASAIAARADLPSLTTSGKSTDFNLFTTGFDATWEVDIFGGHRRSIEAANASAAAAEASLADVQVSLAAEVANAYISLRERQQRLALGERIMQLQQQMIALTQQRVTHGTATSLDLIRAQNQLDATRADQVPLHTDCEIYENQLATLLGQEPGALDQQLNLLAPLPLPPVSVAIGDPVQLLRHRPDIRAAERTLAADTAKIGQAEAARYPSIKLLGVIGLGGTQVSDMTHLDDFSGIIAPTLSWSFLDFGRNAARVDQAEQVRNEAEIKYRQSVLEALRDAEDSLSRFGHGRTSVATLARTKAAADQSLGLVQQRYHAGTTTSIDVLDTTRQQLVAQQNLLQAEANLTRSFVAIQKALGLGWGS